MLVGISCQILAMANFSVFAIISCYIWHVKIKFGSIPVVVWVDIRCHCKVVLELLGNICFHL